MMLSVVIHMCLWWVVYSQQGSFPSDIFSVPMTFHADNFTVPLAVLTTLCMLILMGALGTYIVRRANYDLFFIAHHFSVIIFLVMLWHSVKIINLQYYLISDSFLSV